MSEELNLEVHMYDAKGNIMRCNCGRSASVGIIGENAYAVYCEKCSPLMKQEEPVTLAYLPVVRFNENLDDKICCPDWIVNFVDPEEK